MKRLSKFAKVLGCLAMLSTAVVAQESKEGGERAERQREREQRGNQRGERERMDRRRGETMDRKRGGANTVKDPAGFAKLQEKPLFSGPQKGEKVPSFKVTGLAGKSSGSEFDPVALAGKNLHVILMQDDNRVGLRGLFGIVDALGKIDKKSKTDLHMSCVFLTDDVEQISGTVTRFSDRLTSMGLDVMAVSKDGRDGPGNLGLNRNVKHTIILVKDGKVLHNFAFAQGLLQADPHVLGGVAELIGEKRETVAAWLAEGKDERGMRRGGDDPQEAQKRALRKKLGEYVVAGKLSREDAGELFRTAFPEEAARRSRERSEKRDRD